MVRQNTSCIFHTPCRTKLLESESMLENTKRSASRANQSRMAMSPMNTSSMAMTMGPSVDYSQSGQHLEDILSVAKKDVKKMKKKARRHKISQRYSDRTDDRELVVRT